MSKKRLECSWLARKLMTIALFLSLVIWVHSVLEYSKALTFRVGFQKSPFEDYDIDRYCKHTL